MKKSIKKLFGAFLGLAMTVTSFVGIEGNRVVKTRAIDNAAPLCFTASSSRLTVKLKKNGSPNDIYLEYSTDGEAWNPLSIGLAYTIEANESLYITATSSGNEGFSKSGTDYYCFESSRAIYVSGDVTTLLDKRGIHEKFDPAYHEYVFSRLFYKCNIISAPELPTNQLTSHCYDSMFRQCTSLETAPELPARLLAEYCYSNMFRQCNSLETAPELPAVTVFENCYEYMFNTCLKLTTGPSVLPAKTLANNCYKFMFNGCSLLTKSPFIMATSTINSCFSSMFNACNKLNEVRVAFDSVRATLDIQNWLMNVNPTGKIYAPAGLKLDTNFKSYYTSGLLDDWEFVESKIVSVNVIGDGDAEVDKPIAANSETVNVTATPDEGYRLSSLTYNAGSGDVDILQAKQFTMPSSNVTVTATFLPDVNYTVTFNKNGHGNNVASATVAAGNKVTKPQDPAEAGYIFKGWYKEIDCTTPWNFDSDVVNADTTLFAKWEDDVVDSISLLNPPDKTTYVYGSDIDLYGCVVTVHYVQTGNRDIDPTDEMISGYNENSLGTQTVTINYGGKTTTFFVEVTMVGYKYEYENLCYHITKSGAGGNEVALDGRANVNYTNIVVPESVVINDTEYTVTSIDTEAFDGNAIDSVTLPATITKISSLAFNDCIGLSAIYFEGTSAPTVEMDTFSDSVFAGTTLYVPFEAVDTFKDASGWLNFTSIVGFGKITNNAPLAKQTDNNGYIEVSKTKAIENEKVTITPVADTAYKLDEDSLKVIYGDAQEIIPTAKGDGTYEFDMPKANVTINATFVPAIGNKINEFDLNMSLAYSYVERTTDTPGGDYIDYIESDFRLLLGVSSMVNFAQENGLDNYGIHMSCSNPNVEDKYFNFATYSAVYEDDGIQYVVIDLGDVLNNLERAKDVFTINAYCVSDGHYYESTNSKSYSVASIVKAYMDGENQEAKEAVSTIYTYFEDMLVYVEY